MIEKIAIQGQRGSYSEIAALSLNPDAKIVYTNNFTEAFDCIDSGEADRGCLPFRNTRAGFIQHPYDRLTGHATMGSYWQDEEVVLEIIHCLLAKPGATLDSIREVMSQPEALRQCERWLQSMNGCIQKTEGSDTALSAWEVSKSNRIDFAAIAGKHTAALYGLDVVVEGVQDDALNLTRFVSVRRRELATNIHPEADVTSAILTISEQGPGSLAEALKIFVAESVNIRYINSRHIPNSPLHVDMVTELEVGLTDPRMRKIVEALAQIGTNVTPIGSYKSHKNHQGLQDKGEKIAVLGVQDALDAHDTLVGQFS